VFGQGSTLAGTVVTSKPTRTTVHASAVAEACSARSSTLRSTTHRRRAVAFLIRSVHVRRQQLLPRDRGRPSGAGRSTSVSASRVSLVREQCQSTAPANWFRFHGNRRPTPELPPGGAPAIRGQPSLGNTIRLPRLHPLGGVSGYSVRVRIPPRWPVASADRPGPEPRTGLSAGVRIDPPALARRNARASLPRVDQDLRVRSPGSDQRGPNAAPTPSRPTLSRDQGPAGRPFRRRGRWSVSRNSSRRIAEHEPQVDLPC